MPWFPDFVGAVELVRRQTRVAGHADPVQLYVQALNEGDPGALETVWPADVVVHDPRAGEVRGHRQLRHLVHQSRTWLAEQQACTERVSATCVGERAVVELLAHLNGSGAERAWPVAVAVESSADSAVFRTYCSLWPFPGHQDRPAILDAGGAGPPGIVGRLEAAVREGDVEGAVRTFATDGYLREPAGPDAVHRGAAALTAYYAGCLADGGITREPGAVTDDGTRCVVEYNCTRWGGHDLPPQPGLAVYERNPDGLLAAVRVYDDVVAPGAGHPET